MEAIFDGKSMTARNTEATFWGLVEAIYRSGETDDEDFAVAIATSKLERIMEKVGNDLDQIQTALMFEITRRQDI